MCRWPLVRLTADTGAGVDAATIEGLVVAVWSDERAEGVAADMDGARARWDWDGKRGAGAKALGLIRLSDLGGDRRKNAVL